MAILMTVSWRALVILASERWALCCPFMTRPCHTSPERPVYSRSSRGDDAPNTCVGSPMLVPLLEEISPMSRQPIVYSAKGVDGRSEGTTSMQAEREQDEQKVDTEEKRDMSNVLSKRRERSWIAALRSILLKCQAYAGWWRRRVDQDQSQLVAEVANDLCTTMEIWVVEDGLQTKAHIAWWNRLVETYRGYLLCSDTPGHTFLIDMRTHTYVRGSAAHLVQIDGVDQAKRFVDELCCRLQVDRESP